jgi:hypothetical protein
MTTKRQCGDCQLCCRLLPTAEIAKPENQRCPHQKSYCGCTIYPKRPMSCQLWSCRWLLGDDMADQPRPDRSHIVVDMMPDVIRKVNNATGEIETLPVIVVWIDPAHRDAYKSDVFLRYVKRQTVPVLIRYGSSDSGGVLFPPATTGLDDIAWHGSEIGATMPRTLREKAAAMGATLSERPAPGEYGAVTMTMPDGKSHTIAATTVVDVRHVDTAAQAFDVLRQLSRAKPKG